MRLKYKTHEGGGEHKEEQKITLQVGDGEEAVFTETDVVTLLEEIEKYKEIERMVSESPAMQEIENKKQFLSEMMPQEVETQNYDYQPQQQQQQEAQFNPQDYQPRLQPLPQIFQTGIEEFQDGGQHTDPSPADMAKMKARLAYAQMHGNPAAQRMVSGTDAPYQFPDGREGTHYMASMDNFAVPQIQQDQSGNLILGDFGPMSPEAIRFDTDEDAQMFAENYKQVAPVMLKFGEGGKKKFKIKGIKK